MCVATEDPACETAVQAISRLDVELDRLRFLKEGATVKKAAELSRRIDVLLDQRLELMKKRDR
jgi:hypothetical protein